MLPRLPEGPKQQWTGNEDRFEILGNLTDKALERSLADEKFRRLLILADLTKCNGSRTVTVGFLHTASGGGGLAGRLGSELLAGSLSAGRFACCLLGTSHGHLIESVVAAVAVF